MLGPNDAGVGVGGAAEPYAPPEQHPLQLLGEVHVEEAGVEAAAVELVNDGAGVRLAHHVDKAVAVDDNDVDDVPKAGEEAANVRRVHRVGNMVDVDGEKFQRRHCVCCCDN
jgi:hypothetical protein